MFVVIVAMGLGQNQSLVEHENLVASLILFYLESLNK